MVSDTALLPDLRSPPHCTLRTRAGCCAHQDLDDPSVFEGPQLVTWTSEMQKFHLLPPDVPAYPELPQPPAQKEKA